MSVREERVYEYIGEDGEGDDGKIARANAIRNALLAISEINRSQNINTFNVQVSRSLRRLEKHGLIHKTQLGHKEVYYQVDEKANEQKDKGYRVSLGMIGAFSPYEDMTYEKFK